MAMSINGIPRGEPVFRKEDCSPFDIGVVFNDISSFSAQRTQEFIENVWSPVGDPQFQFLKSKEGFRKCRKFNPTWLQQFIG